MVIYNKTSVNNVENKFHFEYIYIFKASVLSSEITIRWRSLPTKSNIIKNDNASNMNFSIKFSYLLNE